MNVISVFAFNSVNKYKVEHKDLQMIHLLGLINELLVPDL